MLCTMVGNYTYHTEQNLREDEQLARGHIKCQIRIRAMPLWTLSPQTC